MIFETAKKMRAKVIDRLGAPTNPVIEGAGLKVGGIYDLEGLSAFIGATIAAGYKAEMYPVTTKDDHNCIIYVSGRKAADLRVSRLPSM